MRRPVMPKYRNAAHILPTDLLRALQQHASGLCIYVPKPEGRAAWGAKSGSRALLDLRNTTIRQRHSEGVTIPILAAEFHLCEGSIRKILRGKNSSTHFGA
jgi:Mor family transcriptional regulator